MEIAGARGKIYPGDRLITDGRSAVHLILYDGSIVKVGFRSEFLLEKVETKGPFISWLFQLMKGGVRALIEKNPKGETHFEINTRSGTVGVRGTEFVLAYDPETNKSSVFMLTGVVDFGENNCQKKTSCIQVKGGEQSFISSGQSRPSSPEKLDYKKLFDVEASGGGKGANWDSRLSLFLDADRVAGGTASGQDPDALKKLVEESSAKLLAAQNKALGRDKDDAEALRNAIESGEFFDTMEAADAYAKDKGIFDADSNRGAENHLGLVRAAKLRLGDAVKKAEAAGLFQKPRSSAKSAWKGRNFAERAKTDFAREAQSKVARSALDKALSQYLATLEYVEAFNAEQAAAARRALELSRQRSAQMAAVEMGGKTSNSSAECRDNRCMESRLVHEMDTAAEGVVSAFNGQKEDFGGDFWGKPNTGGQISTGTLTRPITPSSCFKEVKECKVVPCQGFVKGKRCRSGETQQVCTSKQIPVRCEGGSSR